MSNTDKVVVIMGGNSAEREISLKSGKNVLTSLERSGINVCSFDLQAHNFNELIQLKASKAFLTTHGRYGEDGALQGALEIIGLPYTGSKVRASSIAFNKYLTKQIWNIYNVPTPKAVCVEKHTFNKNTFNLDIALPVIVKPCSEGSSLGLAKVYQTHELIAAIELAFIYDRQVLIEELISGLEFTIPVFNGKVYPIIQIDAPQDNYDYHHKYFSDETKYYPHPAATQNIQNDIEQYALLAYNSIGASGVARLDFMLDHNNKLQFLEINTLPGMTDHSLVPMSFMAAGVDYDQLCLQILADTALG